MLVRVVSCHHQKAPLEVRERLAFSTKDQLAQAYDRLRDAFPDTEVVVLSTCNRVELYTAQEDSAKAPTRDDVAEFYAAFHGLPPDDFVDALFEQTGPEAVRHLFEVTCGVDSMVLGEPQIVSQVKDAYGLAREHDACGPLTNALFQGALRVSARVRNETRLSEGRVSIASVAVGEFGKSIFDHFRDKTVLVIGAGEMAEETLRYLQEEGVRDVLVVNRSLENAQRLAEKWGGVGRGIDALDECLTKADVIVSTTGAPVAIVTAERFQKARRGREDLPVFVLDLGAPRDFEAGVADVDENVFLYDIDDLEATCEKNRRQRAREIEKARRIVEQEAEKFLHDVYHQATGPIVKRLREEWHEIKDRELEALFRKLEHVDEADRQAIEKSIDRIINKLLHPPLKALRDEAREGTPHGLVEALRRLFHLRE